MKKKPLFKVIELSFKGRLDAATNEQKLLKESFQSRKLSQRSADRQRAISMKAAKQID